MPIFTVRQETLSLRAPWPTAGGGSLDSREVVYIEGLSENGDSIAIGEAANALGIGDTVQRAVGWMRSNARHVNFESHDETLTYLQNNPDAPPSAKAAFEIVALDYQCRRVGAPLWRTLQLPNPNEKNVAVALAPIQPGAFKSDLETYTQAPAIKIILGYSHPEHDLKCVQFARLKTKAPIRIDASGGWLPEAGEDMVHELAQYGIEYIEQPFERGKIEETAALKASSPIAIFLDEDVSSAEDVERVAHACDGVRITLMRAGGISEALRALVKARELGLLVTLGADLESPVAATAAAHLAGLADYFDYTGASFIAGASYLGLSISEGIMTIPERSGLGMIRAADVPG